ncbi:MAG: hypothetical protein QOF73_23 [Thermomicrobiales bacterium]|nr:hypothetical protein [Thermomicrobiales bacterium]
MATPLRVVIVEDNPADANLMVAELQRAEFAPVWQRVETGPAFLAQLDPAPDLILTDVALPAFDGLAALAHVRARGLDVPLIFVSDALDVELAVAAVKAGADDYLPRGGISRLGGAVTQAMSRRRLRAVQQRCELTYRFLTEAGRVLTSSLDYHTTIQALADLVVPGVAGRCDVFVRGDDGVIGRLAMAPRDGSGSHPDSGPASDPSTEPAVPEDVVRVVRSGRPELRRHRATEVGVDKEVDGRREMVASEGAAPFAEARMALVARGRVLGAISFSAGGAGRGFDLVDLGLLEEIGRLAALAIDNGRLHQEVHEALATRDRFLSIAAHELRTPVTEILGFAQLLEAAHERGNADPERQTRYVHRIVEGSNRLTRLAHDLLDARYLDEGELPFRFEMVDLAALVREVAGRQHDQLGSAYQILVEEPRTPCRIRADRDRVEQVLTNLMTNAAKFSPDGGTIRVVVAPDGGGARLTVQDEGIGLPPCTEAAIFAPFTRAPNARDHSVAGMGLGLSISRTIMKRHGGRIWAESAGEGLGTAVMAWFPVPEWARSAMPIARGGAIGGSWSAAVP